MHPTSVSLRQRLLEAEEDFLSARDFLAMESFERKWEVLCDDFKIALEANVLDADVESLAQSVFYRIAILSEDLARLEEETTTSAFMTVVEDLLARMTIEDIAEPRRCHTPSIPTSSTPSSSQIKARKARHSSVSPFIPQAYKWLSTHLHNPYPTTSLKAAMALEAGVSLRTINNWFKTARRHIGWVSLVRRHFNGSRALAIDTAQRVFSGTEDLGVPCEITAALRSIESRLNSLSNDECSDEHLSGPRAWRCRSSGSSSIPTLNRSCGTSSPSPPPSLVFTSSDSEDDSCSLPTILQPTPCTIMLEKEDFSDYHRLSFESNLSTISPRHIAIEIQPNYPWANQPHHTCASSHAPSSSILPKKRRRSDVDNDTRAKRSRYDTSGQKTPQTPLPLSCETSHCNSHAKTNRLARGSDIQPVTHSTCLSHARKKEAEVDSLAPKNQLSPLEDTEFRVCHDTQMLAIRSSTDAANISKPTESGVPESLATLCDLLSGVPLPIVETLPLAQLPLLHFEPSVTLLEDIPLGQKDDYASFLANTESSSLQFDEDLWQSILRLQDSPLDPYRAPVYESVALSTTSSDCIFNTP